MKYMPLALLGYMKILCVSGQMSLNIQLGGETTDSSCHHQEIIKAATKDEFVKQMRQRLTSIFIENPVHDVIISTEFYQDGGYYPTHMTSTSDDDIIPSIENVATTQAAEDYDETWPAVEFDHSTITNYDVSSSLITDTTISSHFLTTTEISYLTTRDSVTKTVKQRTTKKIQDSTFSSMPTTVINDTTSDTTSDYGNSTMTELLTTAVSQISEKCDFMYTSICFRAIWYSIDNVTYTGAKIICEMAAGKLADIRSNDHFDLFVYVIQRKTFAGTTKMMLWTGMTYKNQRTYLSSGNIANLPQNLWYIGEPTSDKDKTRIGIIVNGNMHGLSTSIPASDYNGALCEINEF
uniref:uncharacterized protein LOC120328039 isoform X1 n=1 Tax=Styela clava TaxID=7725 RepID=UPI001939F4C0|nr:uncharacterized protein LOC120328039 isoform X1 [Styela clava]